MAISRTTLKDTMELLIEEQNAKGGVLGAKSKRLSLTLRLTGRSLQKKPASF